ncbi:MAG: hypothetical protein QXN05_02785 [Acidilobaceae archaeon]
MGLRVKGVGIIAIVCKNCGFIACWYAIGDKNNKTKFSGPPTPTKAKNSHDGETCPYCNRKLSDKPEGIYFMSHSKFTKLYQVVGGVRLVVREQAARKSVKEPLADLETGLSGLGDSIVQKRHLVEVEI